MPQPNVTVLAASFRTLMFGILFLIILNVAALYLNATGMNQNIGVALAIVVTSIALSIFLVIQVIKVTKALGWSTGATVACAVAMFVPCVSLIVLIVINQASVKVLKAAGYKVGLMGAKT